MELQESIELAEQSPQFKEWKKTHEDYFFANGFFLEDGSWQLGYSNGSLIVTVNDEDGSVSEPQEALVRPGEKIVGLDVSLVTLKLDDAKEKFNEVLKENYSEEVVVKTLIIVQVIDGDVLYNITGMAQSLHTINVRVKMDGSVLSHSKASLIEQA